MIFENKKLQEFERYLYNKKVAIIDLDVNNIELLDYFSNKGAKVTVFDKRTIDEIDKPILDKITSRCANFSFGEHNLINLVGFDIIFRAPTCRPDLHELKAESLRGAIVTSEIEMAMELFPGKVIGVTGKSGKSTTSNLIYQILKENGCDCYLTSNMKTPLFTQIQNMKPESIMIVELNSFQLMDMQISPEIAVITNTTTDCLDIHKTYEEYILSKKNIFKHQNEKDILVLNYDNNVTRYFSSEANGKVRFFSSKNRLDNGVIYDNGIVKSCEDGVRRHVVTIDDAISLQGIHNYENICAAIAATESLVEPTIQARAITKFKELDVE